MKNAKRLLVLSILICFNGCFEDGQESYIGDRYFPTTYEGDINATLTSITVLNDELILDGANFDNVNDVLLTDGMGFSENFSITTKTSTRIVAAPTRNISILIGNLLSLVLSNAHAQMTYTVTFTLQNDSVSTATIQNGAVTAQKIANMSASDGDVLMFDSGSWGPFPLSGLRLVGTWNANSNTPALADGGANTSPTSGDYYIIGTAGTTSIDGENNWNVSDWIIYDGTQWRKIGSSSDFKRDGSVAMTGGLNLNSNNLNNANNVNVQGNVVVNGLVSLKDNDGTDNYVTLRAPTALGSNLNFIFPDGYGSNGDFLMSDGAGNLSWSSVSAGDITGITTGASSGLSGGATSGTASLSVNVDNTTIEINSNDLRVKDGGITNAKLDSSIDAAKITVGTLPTGVLPGTTSLLGSMIESSEISDDTITNADINASAGIAWSKISKVGALAGDVGAVASSDVDTDDNLAADSDGRVPSQRAVKGYVDDQNFLSLTGITPSSDHVLLYNGATWEATTDFRPDGSVAMTGDLDLNSNNLNNANNVMVDSRVFLKDNDGSNDYITLRAPTNLSGNVNFVFPVNDGNSGDFLMSDGAGNLSWSSVNMGDITGVTTGVSSGLSGGATSGTASLSVNVDNTTIEINSNDLRVKDGGITNAKLDSSIDAAKITVGTLPTGVLPGTVSLLGSTIESSEISDDTITNADINASAGIAWSKISKVGALAGDVGAVASSDVDTDDNLAADSDGRVPSQRAVKGYVDDQNFLSLTGITPSSDHVLLYNGATWEATTDFRPDGSVAMTGDLDLNSNNLNNANNVMVDSRVFLKDNDGSNDYITLRAPTNLSGNVNFVFPVNDGNSGDFLMSDGAGNLSWSSVNMGDITGVTTGVSSGLSGGATSGTASLSVNVDNTTIEINSNDLRVKDGGITNAKLDSSIDAAKITVGTLPTGVLPGTVSLLGSTIESSEISDDTITNADINASAGIAWSKISKVGALAGDVGAVASSDVDTDDNLAADSDGRVPSQRAVKGYVDDQNFLSLTGITPTTGQILRFNGTAWEAVTFFDAVETASGFIDLYDAIQKGDDGQMAQTAQVVMATTSNKVQIASASDNNVVEIFNSGADRIAGTVNQRLFLNRGDVRVLTGYSPGTVITSTGGISGVSENLGTHSTYEGPMPLGVEAFSARQFFFFAFRFSSGGSQDTGRVYVSAGAAPATTVRFLDGSGSEVDSRDLAAFGYTTFDTTADAEYQLVATQPVFAAVVSAVGYRNSDVRLIPPLATRLIGYSHNGRVSALYSNTLVTYHGRDGQTGSFTVSPGSPIELSTELTSTFSKYHPDGAVILRASGPISCFSGADDSGTNATEYYPLNVLAQRIPLPLASVTNGDQAISSIAVASPYEGTVRFFNTDGSLYGTINMTRGGSIPPTDSTSDQQFPAAGRLDIGTNFLGGYAEGDVPFYLVYNSHENDTLVTNGIETNADETTFPGITPENIRATIKTDANGLNRLLVIDASGDQAWEIR